MATKAEQFRAAVERSRPEPMSHAGKRPRPKPTRATHLASKATFKREETVGRGRPSRKSTRKAANRVKPDANLERRQKRDTHSPETRARTARVRQRKRIDERVAPRSGVR
jgi:hypothetical protein